MFLRITRTSVESANYTQAMGLSQDVVDTIKQLPGAHSVSMAGDPSSGQAVIISVWDTREHAEFDRALVSDIVSRAQNLGAQFVAPEIYEIGAQG